MATESDCLLLQCTKSVLSFELYEEKAPNIQQPWLLDFLKLIFYERSYSSLYGKNILELIMFKILIMGQTCGGCLRASNHSLIIMSEKGQSQLGKYSPTHRELLQKDYLHQDKRNYEKTMIQK